MLLPQQQNGVSWLGLGLWQIDVEGNGWVSSSQRGGSAILGGPWRFGDHGCAGTARGLTGDWAAWQCKAAFPIWQLWLGSGLGPAPCFGSKIANITEIQNLTKKIYLFLPTWTKYSMEDFICRKIQKFDHCFILKNCNSIVTLAWCRIDSTLIWKTAREGKRKHMTKVSTYLSIYLVLNISGAASVAQK